MHNRLVVRVAALPFRHVLLFAGCLGVAYRLRDGGLGEVLLQAGVCLSLHLCVHELLSTLQKAEDAYLACDSSQDLEQWASKAELNDDVSARWLATQRKQHAPRYARRHQADEQHREVHRVEQHRHRLVPPENHQHAIHPGRYLSDT